MQFSKNRVGRGCALLGMTLLMQCVATLASACSFDQSGYMPICGGLTISPETDVVVIESHDRPSRSNIILGAKEYSAEHVNIEIGEVERPLTIVVTHYDAAILHFSGNVDQIEQVIAMGARKRGWDHVAVTGIDTRKVTFLPVIGKNKDLKTTCSAPPNACVPQQYFKLGKWWRRWFNDVPLDPWLSRTSPAMHIKARRRGTIFIPPKPETAPAPIPKINFPPGWRGELERYSASSGARVIFEQDQLVSPTTIALDPNLPSWAGIFSLIDKGEIRPADDYATDPDLMRFSEKFSAKYRSRFDPDFSFEPKIDFVLSPYFLGPLPRDLRHSEWRSVTFLRTGPYLQEPSQGDQGDYCFFSENNKLAQPSGSNKTKLNWERWRSTCRAGNLGSRMGFSMQNADRLAQLQLKAARELETNRRKVKTNTKLCPLLDIPEDAEVVVLSTENGRKGNGVSFTHCKIETSHHSVGSGRADETVNGPVDQCDAGKVDVKIDRKGPVFLFLKAHSAINWNLDVSNTTQISGVATIGDRRQMVTGLPEGVPFSQYVPRDGKLPEGCRNKRLDAHPLAGGPAIQLFEVMFDKVSGRKIDVLMNKGLAPERDAQTPEVIRDYTTFVVD